MNVPPLNCLQIGDVAPWITLGLEHPEPPENPEEHKHFASQAAKAILGRETTELVLNQRKIFAGTGKPLAPIPVAPEVVERLQTICRLGKEVLETYTPLLKDGICKKLLFQMSWLNNEKVVQVGQRVFGWTSIENRDSLGAALLNHGTCWH